VEAGRPSGTAEGPAALRALHQVLDDEPRILIDPVAARLVGPELDRQRKASRLFPFLTCFERIS
jgi:O-methyltransferase involved in polyketide biosynthesis